jgi:hypothetical protein
MMGDAMATMQTVVTWRRWRRDGTADSGRVVGECQLGVAWCIDTHESRGQHAPGGRRATKKRPRDPKEDPEATSERQREPKTASGGGLRRAADQRGCGGGGGITRRAASIVAAVRA